MEITHNDIASFHPARTTPEAKVVVFVRCRADAMDKVMFEALTKSAARALIAV